LCHRLEPVTAVLRRHARQFIIHRVGVALEGLELTVFTDRKWLEFILMQILTNAVKYRRDGQAAVRIWATMQDDAQRRDAGGNCDNLRSVIRKGRWSSFVAQKAAKNWETLRNIKKTCERLRPDICGWSEQIPGTQL
jgi:signal transduction histidine kinase